MTQWVPILVYHHVYPDDELALKGVPKEKATGLIGVSEFRRQLDHISEGGWEVVSTTRILDWLEGGADIPDRALVLHFDNGWLDTATTVMPVLVEYGMAGTAYVITDGATAASEGRTAGVHTSTEGTVQKPFMTWRQISELLDVGWEIGAHTATHPKLADLQRSEGDEAVLREVEGSSRAYAEHLGFVPRHFAYPSGSRNRRTDALLAPYYRSLRLWSFSQPPRWEFTGSGTPPAALQCQNVDSTVAFEDFARIFTEAVGQ